MNNVDEFVDITPFPVKPSVSMVYSCFAKLLKTCTTFWVYIGLHFYTFNNDIMTLDPKEGVSTKVSTNDVCNIRYNQWK